MMVTCIKNSQAYSKGCIKAKTTWAKRTHNSIYTLKERFEALHLNILLIS